MQLKGDSYFLLIAISLALQSVEMDNGGPQINVDELKLKYLGPLKEIAMIFHMPRDTVILGLIAAFLIKLALPC
jgi:hypothetical protein